MHIPKTGGRFVSINIFPFIEKIIQVNNLNKDKFIFESSHRGIYPLSLYKNCYSFSLMRNPVERTISHFLFFNKNDEFKINKKTKNIFLDWLEDNEFIRNYQSKYFLIYDENIYENINEIKLREIKKEGVIQNIKKIKKVYRTESIDNKMIQEIFKLTIEHCELLEYYKSRPIISIPSQKNYKSAELFKIMSKKEKSLIESYNELDMDIYNTGSLFH
jgi:hypothetical protein